VPLSPIVSRYDQLILDLDGCVYVGERATPGAVEAIAKLREAGKRIAFATNDPRHATEDYVTKLWGLGIKASLADVVTVGGAMQHLLAETRHGRTAFVIGTEAMLRHVSGAGLHVLNGTDLASRADVVVVAGTEELVYDDLKNAALAVQRGADFLAAARDPTYPQPDGFWPGTGALLAAVEYASGRTASIVGKPEPQLFLTALDRLGPGRTLVVGDRLDTDVAAAAHAELDAALVLTGQTTREDLEGADPQPVAVADDLAALVSRDGATR
jgi:HAD superfamily hydrolase (TIGR01450 family)